MNKLTPTAVRIASITGLTLGAFALSALATDWTAAPCTAPACNTAAPINESINPQHKSGPLSINKSVGPDVGFALDVIGIGYFQGLGVGGLTNTMTLQVQSGNPVAGKSILQAANGSGLTQWVDPSTLIAGTSIPGSIVGAGNMFFSQFGHGTTLLANWCTVELGPSSICTYNINRYVFTCPSGSTVFSTGAGFTSDSSGGIMDMSSAQGEHFVCIKN